MTRWFHSFWAEEDIWFYVEVDADGWVARQVELQGPFRTPIATAFLAEWEVVQQAKALAAYESTFGFTVEIPVHDWEGYEPQDLEAEDCEAVRLAARDACRTRARTAGPHPA